MNQNVSQNISFGEVSFCSSGKCSEQHGRNSTPMEQISFLFTALKLRDISLFKNSPF
jgi:hypothetical protein